MRAGVVLVAAIALVAACGTPSVAPSGSPAPTGSADVPSIPQLEPGMVGITCGDEIVFHPALLEQEGRAETDPDPAAQALRDYLAAPEGPELPRSGWVRVAQTGSKVQFVAPDPAGGYAVVGFFVHQGGWTLDLAGGCRPEVALPGGVSRATWRLDPGFPAPAAGDRTIHVLINEVACASGTSPEGRVVAPAVAVSERAVTIAILVRTRPGANECPGNPEFAMAIDLPEPLGGRPLFDGAVFPPAGPVTTTTP
jgi:hypothetical protein